MKKLIYLFLLYFLTSGCSNSNIDEKLLPGTYRNNQDLSDYIILDKDYSYVHKYVGVRGNIFECNGKWHYNGKEVVFDDFVFFNGAGVGAGKGTWFSKVDKREGRILLIYSSDNDIYYAK